MEEMLTFYKENRHGSPGQLGENVVDERGVVVNETCHEEWDKILDKMIHLLNNTFPICRTIEYRQIGGHPFWGDRAYA